MPMPITVSEFKHQLTCSYYKRVLHSFPIKKICWNNVKHKFTVWGEAHNFTHTQANFCMEL